jgi:adenylate cyclase
LWGVLIGVILSLPLIVPVDLVTGMELNAGDQLFIRENGPHLGYQSHRNDIVLIRVPSSVRDPALDAELYTALLRAGVSVVADPRPMTSAEDAKDLVLALQEMPGAGGHVFRNIQLVSTGVLSDEQKSAFVAADILYADAGFDINHTLRYYPLHAVDIDGRMDETLVVRAARTAFGQHPMPSAMRDSGVLGVWSRLGLKGAPKDAQSVSPRPYPLGGGHSVTWIVHPSKELPGLISPAAMWINYRSQPGTYTRYEGADVLSGKVSQRALHNKIVIVDGTPAVFDSPTSSRLITWAEADAQAMEEILDGAYLVPEGREALAGVVLLALIGSVMFALIDVRRAIGIGIVVLAAYLVVSVIAYRRGMFPDLVLAPIALVAASVASGTTRQIQRAADRRRIFTVFGRQLPPRDANAAMRGSKREVTVLFADVRGLAGIAEREAAGDVLRQLNATLNPVTQAALDEQGTVHKYVGEAVMVLFNAPLDQPDHSLRAVRAALKMQAAMGQGSLAVGIGIHTGQAVVGAIGLPERHEFTAVGPTVELAYGLSESAGTGEIVVSEEVRLRLGDEIEAEARAPITIRGVGGGIATYLITGVREA